MGRLNNSGTSISSVRTFLPVLVVLCIAVLTYGEKDFEFTDSEARKKTMTLLDDEDFLKDEPGSGDEVEGSGPDTTEIPVKPTMPKHPVEYFRVTINFTDLIYTGALGDRYSQEFRNLAQQLADAIELLFKDIPGQQQVKVLAFRIPGSLQGSLLLTFDLGTQGYYDRMSLFNILNTAVNSGSIPPYNVSPVGFSFRPLDVNMCPSKVGRDPTRLPRSGNNWANLMINNAFPCDGYIVAWQYYRIIPRYVGFVGVWRQSSDSEFTLIGKTLLPVAPEGNHTIAVEPPMFVRKGDFIGVFYPREAEEGVVASATAAEGAVSENELYQNYYAPFYEDMIQENVPFNINQVTFSETATTFALRALMDYAGVDHETAPPVSACPTGEFKCDDGECVDGRYKCDGQMDCFDNSDEKNCQAISCPTDEFLCKNGFQCIPRIFHCNQQVECDDGSDEEGCPTKQCSRTEWRCANGDCIASDYRCDGRRDCADGSDESDSECISTDICPEGQYRCNDGLCIPSALRCDGTAQCEDGSDEIKCGTSTVCQEDEFQCEDNSRCIPLRRQCDGQIDCPDSSDEALHYCAEVCDKTQFWCDDGECIDKALQCDRKNDCRDGSDELFCDLACLDGQFLCDDQVCIDSRLQCNGYNDCADGSDESRTVCGEFAGCRGDQFQCASLNECIDAVNRCDEFPDCSDRSDEIGCPCKDGQFRCDDGFCIDEEFWCDGIPHCEDRSDESDCVLRCTSEEFLCASGNQCIPASFHCNRQRECADGSDEIGCECTEDQFRCDGTCIELSQRCDGRRDCADGSDELACPCRDGMFQCHNGDCIPENRRCDRTPDCEDGSDEFDGCSCSDEEFYCQPGMCISSRRRCDQIADCPNGNDEVNCREECTAEQFACRNDGSCIDARRKCDGRADCGDRSDEENCRPKCTEDQFECRSDGHCIDSRRVCDGRADCVDSSDEQQNCRAACRADQFTCQNGDCIDQRRACDGRPDCSDSSDEQNCPSAPTCGPNNFQCGTGHCIDSRRRCDGRDDCPDASDEESCPRQCRSDEFQCIRDRTCISREAYCNGRNDCEDGSDESDCPRPHTCELGYFLCGTGHCLDERRHCDGRNDCPDSSDETDCPLPSRCREGEFRCVSDGTCISQSNYCNGQYDCQDGSDETDCTTRCRANEFQCDNGRCLSSASRCNGRVECEDSSDERGCPRPIIVTATPPILRVRLGREAVFECQAIGSPPPLVRWTRGDRALPLQASDVNGRLTIPVARVEDSGDYVCSAVGVSGTYQDSVTLDVQDITAPTTRPPSGDCSRDEAVCQNGQCIPSDYRCDGEQDCSDGSDEVNCIFNPCEPNEFRCSNERCVMKIWRCDGDNDCGDGSDESNCPTRQPGDPCLADEYHCLSGDQCIPMSYQCDTEIDCQDRSDEIGCAAPTIVVPPVAEIEVEIGGAFTIICEAVGVPIPLIVWRLNWGNIPTGDRVTVISESGRGSLTITDAREEDSGAYTCEAINNKGSIFAIPDAIIIVRRQAGVCTPPLYNVDARVPDECVQCFCFGQVKQCYSSSLQISQINLASEMQLVDIETQRSVEQVYVQYYPSRREHSVTDFQRVMRGGQYYWRLPAEFLGNRLTSYGGDLKYTIFYEIAGFPAPTEDADVIIRGNGITLYHRSQTSINPSSSVSLTVPFIEKAWERGDGPMRGDTPVSEYASRSDLMMVLENVTSIYIRAGYDTLQTSTRISNVVMTGAVSQETGLGQAVLVEDCVCPTGYTGLSCQECAAGFHRVTSGRYLGECVQCNCNGHSNDCHPLTGECLFCKDYSYGPRCEYCLDGYYGDSRQGTPNACQPCPCPLTQAPNQFSPTCRLDNSGLVQCTACPTGYEGSQCERCAHGYIGNPRAPGSSCRPSHVEELCDSRGSDSRQPDSLTQRCRCKQNVEGKLCDRCAENNFHLHLNNLYGCISCFCMGVTRACTSTSWERTRIGASFTPDRIDITLTDIMQKNTIEQGFAVNPNIRELTYRGFNNQPKTTYYWSLPARFLGDKVTAYGGSLRFNIRYRPGFDSSSSDDGQPLVIIKGNEYTLVYREDQTARPNTPTPYNVRFYEQNWARLDGEPAQREFILMALADVEAILIRATFTESTDEAGIRDVSMDIAENRRTSQNRALAVEQCICPRGYKGLSCEDCDTGYTRTGGGLYLGLCEPCQCNGHSSECDAETGVCRNCRHNTAGDHCEQCAVGYYGVATQGRHSDCQPCPCPLESPPNQFSQTCSLATDGQVTCTQCPSGHAGRRCERCEPGYQGNPLRRGDYCKPSVGPVCDCDEQGTIPNAQCDATTRLCQCKSNAQGRRCSTCREGYFYMSRDNPEGCLSCFCMGITNQCTSSSYYRDNIRPHIGNDGSHNFVMTNRRLNNIIKDGFEVDSGRSQITFNRFEGVQRERESMFFNLPPRFRGDMVSSYGGNLHFTIEFSASPTEGSRYMDVDIEIVTSGQALRMYHLFEPHLEDGDVQTYDIPMTEASFKLMDGSTPTRDSFLTILADIEAILIRATHHSKMYSVTLRDLSMGVAVPTVTGVGQAPMVESCRCPEGYTGLSCQKCAAGYLRTQDSATAVGRCVRCNCNGHGASCDPDTGRCLNCQHNTVGDRCDKCADGFYGDSTVGTANDCRPCPCPLTIPSNQFSRTCYMAPDSQVTCDRCSQGYSGRDCGTCATGYRGSPHEAGGTCTRITAELIPVVTVSPTLLEEPVDAVVVFQCNVRGEGPINVAWSQHNGRGLPPNAQVGPNYELTIRSIHQRDSGRYVCTATNVYGSSREIVELRVYARQNIRVRIEEPREITVEEGSKVKFVCTAVASHREPTYILSWGKQDDILPARAIAQNGVLVIPNVRREDAGNYICTGSDMHSIDTAMAILTVSAGEQAPQIHIEPRFQTVNQGDNVEFRCVIDGGRPRPSLEWTRGGSAQLPASATVEGGLFRIPSVSPGDEAEYFCRASNAAGSTEVRTILYVKRTVPEVTVIVRKTTYIYPIGTTAFLECYVQDGTGEYTLVWSRRAGSLPPGSSQDAGVLTIPNLQQSYGGNYICTASTSTGIQGSVVTTLSISLEPEAVAPTATVEPNKIMVPTGTTGTLRCVVTGTPQPTITWSRSRGQLGANHQVNGEVLRISQATMEDRGIYICRAENAAGSAQGWAIVDIERRERPEIELYPKSTQSIPVGGSALFQCRVMHGDPPPVVTWSRVGGVLITSTTETMENGVLMFKRVTGEETGSYICTATNDMGTISATATLIVQGPPTVLIKPTQEIIYAIVGERVTLECIGEGDPVPNVFWRDTRGPRRGDTFPEGLEAELGSAMLVIEEATREDSGTYICVAQNTGGRSEDDIRIDVSSRDSREQRGVSISGPGTLSVFEGQNVELTCSASDLRNPIIHWRRREGPLPPSHRVRNGVLYIPNFQSQYSGEYVCSATVQEDNYEASVFIIVTVSPRLTISPTRVRSRAGEAVSLHCQAEGTGPFTIEWTKMEGILSPTAYERDGTLEIRRVTAADAGRYRCIVTNQAGTSDAYAMVEVIVIPSVTVSSREEYRKVGDSVELRCQASGTPPPRIRWEKDGGSLPPEHQIQNGILTIYNLAREDEGRYICYATNEVGTGQEYVYLRIESQPDINGPVRTDTQTVKVGERIEMECIVTGTPPPVVTWSKVESAIPRRAIVDDGLLVIPEVHVEDAGTYICTANNAAGSVQSHIVLYVQAKPLISVPADMATAALGGPSTLSCDAQGHPAPEISWYRRDGDMPRDYTIENGDLQIERVRPEDSGTYVCSAHNQYGQDEHPMELVVEDLVPYFPQNPVSYISYPPLNDVYLDFDVLLSLRPETTDGMVLYNGQYEDGGGDFVCFGLNEGYPEFRYDVGSGPAVIRGNRTLELNEWHTVRLARNRKEGSMIVNDQSTYTGQSPGRFQGLDLVEDMYLGSVPDFSKIPRAVGYRSGFVGSVSQVKLKDVSLNLGAEAKEVHGIEQSHVCSSRPCYNGGLCHASNSDHGFQCVCPQGFAGFRCETTGQRCYTGACGQYGRCYNLHGADGYRCVCPTGKTGLGCRDDLRILTPFFNQTSFATYATIQNALLQLTINLEFKPHSLDDGIILYSGQKDDGSGDFIALLIKDGYLEFRFDTGSGPAVVRSRNQILADQWTRVVVERKGREGLLIVNNEEPVKVRPWNFYNNNFNNYYYRYKRYRRETSPGSTVGLNMKTPLYLGGVDPRLTISGGVGASDGFLGCIAELKVNENIVDLVRNAVETLGVTDCGERNLCDRRPCQNGGVCADLPGPSFSCQCPATHAGTNCETEINICITAQPCQNSGKCSITDDGYRCDCPISFMGTKCEASVALDKRIEVGGDGYIEISSELLPHRNGQERETVAFTVRTTEREGLLFWHGQKPGRQLQGGDFLAVGVKDGYVIFSYELGSGPAEIRSNVQVDDGYPHKIVATRLGRSGSLTVDAGEPVTGDAQGILQMLNVQGNIYIGGVPFYTDQMTGGKFGHNFSGCIEDIVIKDKGPLVIPEDAVEGYNLRPCISRK